MYRAGYRARAVPGKPESSGIAHNRQNDQNRQKCHFARFAQKWSLWASRRLPEVSFTPFWASRGGSQRCLFTPVLGFPGCPRSVFYASSGLPRKCPRGVFYAVLGFPGCPRGVFYAAFQAREAQDQGSQGSQGSPGPGKPGKTRGSPGAAGADRHGSRKTVSSWAVIRPASRGSLLPSRS